MDASTGVLWWHLAELGFAQPLGTGAWYMMHRAHTGWWRCRALVAVQAQQCSSAAAWAGGTIGSPGRTHGRVDWQASGQPQTGARAQAGTLSQSVRAGGLDLADVAGSAKPPVVVITMDAQPIVIYVR